MSTPLSSSLASSARIRTTPGARPMRRIPRRVDELGLHVAGFETEAEMIAHALRSERPGARYASPPAEGE